jgi:hypothetical protein
MTPFVGKGKDDDTDIRHSEGAISIIYRPHVTSIVQSTLLLVVSRLDRARKCPKLIIKRRGKCILLVVCPAVLRFSRYSSAFRVAGIAIQEMRQRGLYLIHVVNLNTSFHPSRIPCLQFKPMRRRIRLFFSSWETRENTGNDARRS